MDAEKALDDLKGLAHDAEALLQATAGDLSEKAHDARSRLRGALQSAQETCDALQDKAIEGARATDRLIRDHPYQSIGLAFGVGLLVGVLAISRGYR